MHHLLYDASPEACVVASPGDMMHHLLYDASPEMSITHISRLLAIAYCLLIAQPLLVEN